MKIKKILSERVFLVMTGFACNNNCLMCSVRPKGFFYKPRSTEELLKDIREGKKQNYQRIEFTGGEPTLRKDLLTLIMKAKQLGYEEIAISTNARTLSNLSFIKLLKKNGLNRITSTLYGYNSKTHELVTRTPGSFQQTVQGIKNALNLNIITTVNTVVFSLTVKNLKKIGQFLISLGIKYWTLLDLIPDGYALDNYNKFAVSPTYLKNVFKDIIPILNKFELVNFMDFPYCLFPSELLAQSNCNFIAAKGRTEIINQVGYKPKRFKEKNNIYFDIHKIRSNKCKKCVYNDECGGIWIPYIDLYGKSFIKPFSKRIQNNKDI